MPASLLVAERDAAQRPIIEMLLVEDGFELTFVESGREALAHLKEHTPDLALLALDLPDLTGVEICEKMKRVTRLSDVPVVLVAPATTSGAVDPQARDLARVAGADLLIQRPLGDKNLRERIATLLASEAATRRRPKKETLATGDREELVDEIKSNARRDDLEQENRRLRERIAALEARLAEAEERLAGTEAAPGDSAGDARAKLEEQRRQIQRLERRNSLLVEEIEKLKSERSGKRRRGLFGGRDG